MRTLNFVIKAPFFVLILFAVNAVSGSGHWWATKPALIIGVFWLLAVMRVIRTAVILGGVAGLVALWNRR
jgi:hypothetical protein